MCRRSLLVASLLLFSIPSFAQRGQASLSEGEVEQVREAAYIANDRVMVFIKIMDVRIKALEDLYAKPRRPGREQDTHDLFQQIGGIADELDDKAGEAVRAYIRGITDLIGRLEDAI